MGTTAGVGVILASLLCSLSMAEAAPLRVRLPEGNARGFLVLRSLDGDDIAYGGYPGLAAAAGVAHPMWIDARDRSHLDQEIFGARLSSAAFSAAAPPR